MSWFFRKDVPGAGRVETEQDASPPEEFCEVAPGVSGEEAPDVSAIAGGESACTAGPDGAAGGPGSSGEEAEGEAAGQGAMPPRQDRSVTGPSHGPDNRAQDGQRPGSDAAEV